MAFLTATAGDQSSSRMRSALRVHGLQLAPVSVQMFVGVEVRIVAHDVFVGTVLPGVIV
jgi:hypothetical protein